MAHLESFLNFFYSACWIISPYIPILQKKVSGLSFDFLILNQVGYTAVFISMLLQYFFMDSGIGLFDLLYAMNGLLLNTINVFTKLYRTSPIMDKYHLPYSKAILTEKPHLSGKGKIMHNKMTRFYFRIVFFTVVMMCLFILAYLMRFLRIEALTTFLSVVKMAMSFIKNFPQIKQNTKQDMKKTFPILQTCFDVAGCIALLIYTFKIGFNFTKFSISIVTLTFMFIYIYQYVRSTRMLNKPTIY